jgi:long-chain acyl-CoA synthetase
VGTQLVAGTEVGEARTARGARRAEEARPFLGATVPDLLYRALERWPNRAALQQRLGSGRWRPVSTQELRVDVEDIALGLRALGLERGDRVAFLLRSDSDFVRLDLGCLLGGLIDVPIYLDLSPTAARALLDHSGATALAVADNEILDRFAPALEGSAVQLVVVCRPDSAELDALARAREAVPPAARVLTLAGLCGHGRSRRGEDSGLAARLRTELDPADLATLIYTSGTTGHPKGVMLSHQNLTFNALAALSVFGGYRPGEGGEQVLCFLPLPHSFQRALCYGALAQGSTMYFSHRDHLGEDLAFVRPTLFAAVPRVLEKAQERIVMRVETQVGWRRRVALWALERARRHDPARPLRGLERLRHAAADRLVYGKWRAAFGGRVRYIIAGGAAVAGELVDFFDAAGVEVLQGYGLTESSPGIAYNRPGRSRSGTVGEALPGVEVRISPDGEVQTRGPHVMLGYYRDEEATRKVLDEDGWLHTGDRGALDEHGYLRITGRLKDEFKLSTGKYVFPDPLERRLERDPLIEHAVVFGSGHPYCVALLFLSPEPTLRWAAGNGLVAHHGSGDLAAAPLPKKLLAAPELLARLREAVVRANADADKWEHVQRFTLLAGPLSIESGLLTPTLKVRRVALAERHAAELDALYQAQPGDEPPSPVVVT